jgi:hypothetical protein
MGQNRQSSGLIILLTSGGAAPRFLRLAKTVTLNSGQSELVTKSGATEKIADFSPTAIGTNPMIGTQKVPKETPGGGFLRKHGGRIRGLSGVEHLAGTIMGFDRRNPLVGLAVVNEASRKTFLG